VLLSIRLEARKEQPLANGHYVKIHKRSRDNGAAVAALVKNYAGR
jgi:hypothetical protein